MTTLLLFSIILLIPVSLFFVIVLGIIIYLILFFK